MAKKAKLSKITCLKRQIIPFKNETFVPKKCFLLLRYCFTLLSLIAKPLYSKAKTFRTILCVPILKLDLLTFV